MATKKQKANVLLIDGSNYLYRGGYAVPPLSTKDGKHTNAIKGFMNILIADIHVLRPTHVIVAWDVKGGSAWRRELYPEYKGTRLRGKDTPQIVKDISSQAKPLRKLLKAIGIRCSLLTGQEADDILGTLAVTFSTEGHSVIISSKDKDFAQLVTDGQGDSYSVNMLVAESRSLLDEAGIKKKFGVRPSQIIDYLALQGDGADNIPGIKGCGGATAAKLLVAHKTLKGVIKNKKSLTPKLLENFEAVEHMFPLTKKLIKIKTDLNLKTTLKNSALPKEIFDEVRFNKICKDLELAVTQKQILQAIKRK